MELNIPALNFSCTACGERMNPNKFHNFKRHIHLSVLICRTCFEFYGEGNFLQDDSGDLNCRWCADGGRLISCDYCTSAFCTKCIQRNMGKRELCVLTIMDTWSCYCCDSTPLEPLRKFCNEVMNYLEYKKKKNQMRKNGEQKTSTWAVDFINNSGKRLHESKSHLTKLKHNLSRNSDKINVCKCGNELLMLLTKHYKEIKLLLGVLRHNLNESQHVKFSEENGTESSRVEGKGNLLLDDNCRGGESRKLFSALEISRAEEQAPKEINSTEMLNGVQVIKIENEVPYERRNSCDTNTEIPEQDVLWQPRNETCETTSLEDVRKCSVNNDRKLDYFAKHVAATEEYNERPVKRPKPTNSAISLEHTHDGVSQPNFHKELPVRDCRPSDAVREGRHTDMNESPQQCKLFIGGLKRNTTEDSLKEHFGRWGEVVDCVVLRFRDTKNSRGCGFVMYRESRMADHALMCKPHVIDGTRVDVKRALSRLDAGKMKEHVMRTKVFVGGLAPDVRESDLWEYFCNYGNISKVKIMQERETGAKRGFAFVEFENPDSVVKVLFEQWHVLKGKRIEVRKASSSEGAEHTEVGVDFVTCCRESFSSGSSENHCQYDVQNGNPFRSNLVTKNHIQNYWYFEGQNHFGNPQIDFRENQGPFPSGAPFTTENYYMDPRGSQNHLMGFHGYFPSSGGSGQEPFGAAQRLFAYNQNAYGGAQHPWTAVGHQEFTGGQDSRAIYSNTCNSPYSYFMGSQGPLMQGQVDFLAGGHHFYNHMGTF